MKRLTALLLCFLLLCTCSVTALAAAPEEEVESTVISLSVPEAHKITVTAEDAKVFYEGVSGEEFAIPRLSEPRLLIRAESGKVIKSVMINGEDVTEKLRGGYLDLEPVFEDKSLVVTTEEEKEAPEETYVVTGKVTLNGAPLSEVDLELRSTLKTTKTDKDGVFAFTDVEAGEHSLTALKDGKVIGYLSFELKKGESADLALSEKGSYVITLDEIGVGVELHLELMEEEGTLVPRDAVTLQPPSTPDTGDRTKVLLWWGLLVASFACMAAFGIFRRRITEK